MREAQGSIGAVLLLEVGGVNVPLARAAVGGVDCPLRWAREFDSDEFLTGAFGRRTGVLVSDAASFDTSPAEKLRLREELSCP